MERENEHVREHGEHSTVREKVEKERLEFHSLLAMNPNYFGNLIDSPYEKVIDLAGNTTYEELTCIGFNPNLNQLEATVPVKLLLRLLGRTVRAWVNRVRPVLCRLRRRVGGRRPGLGRCP